MKRTAGPCCGVTAWFAFINSRSGRRRGSIAEGRRAHRPKCMYPLFQLNFHGSLTRLVLGKIRKPGCGQLWNTGSILLHCCLVAII